MEQDDAPSTGRMSSFQKLWLIAYMELYPAMAHKQCCDQIGALRDPQRQKQWEQVAVELNGMNGARKPAIGWKKCWEQLISRTRQKVSSPCCLQCGIEEAKTIGGGLHLIEWRLVRLIWEEEQVAKAHITAAAIRVQLPICYHFYGDRGPLPDAANSKD